VLARGPDIVQALQDFQAALGHKIGEPAGQVQHG
jgi:hypothetical protein